MLTNDARKALSFQFEALSGAAAATTPNLQFDRKSRAAQNLKLNHLKLKAGRTAFTLVELILVMAVLATVMALAVPSLSRSLRDRNLAQEAKRFIALTEYARNEAISQGVPMTVWIDVENGRFGAEPKTGFSGNDNTQKEFSLNPDVHFENLSTAQGQNELSQAIEFAPDGVPEPTSIASIELADRFGSVVAITKTQDKLGYEIEDASAVTNKK